MADFSLTDMVNGNYLKSLASGSKKSDQNYTPAQPSDAQRNADYAAKKLAQPKQAAPVSGSGSSPLSTTMTPVTKAKGK